MSRRTFVVVVESDGGRLSRTVGPYRCALDANRDAKAWDGKEGRRAWAEPVHSPDEFRANPALPIAVHS